jgi:hypothetical protein
LRLKVRKLEERQQQHDEALAAVIEAMKGLFSPAPESKKRKIGFNPDGG